MMSAFAKSRSGVDNINQANLQLHQNCNWVATKKTFLFGAGLNNVLALEQCVIKSPPHMQHWRIVQVRHKAEKAPTAPNAPKAPAIVYGIHYLLHAVHATDTKRTESL